MTAPRKPAAFRIEPEAAPTQDAPKARQAELLRMVRRLDLEPAADRLDRLADYARALAARLGKADLRVETAADDIRFDRHRWAPFWSAFIPM